jgi:hypothetical protein
MIVGLNTRVPRALYNGLIQSGVSPSIAGELSKLPPVSYLFAALLGYNPLGTLLGPTVLNSLPAGVAAKLTSRSFFSQLISLSFHQGLLIVFTFSVVICLMAAAASWQRGREVVQKAGE